MSTAAIATRHIDTDHSSRTTAHASHAQTSAANPEIRAIAGGLYPGRKQALHARNQHSVAEHEPSSEYFDRRRAARNDTAAKPRLLQEMQGVSYNLSSGERVMAAGAGIPFSLAAIAAMML